MVTKQRIALISLIGIIVFGLLLGAKLFYNNKWLNTSLAKQMEGVQGVVSVQVVTNEKVSELQVSTANVENLRQLSQTLLTISPNRQIRLLDNRSPQLEEVFDAMQFPIQEAIATGNFTVMEQKVRELADEAGVELMLTMDNKAVYLTLNQNENQLVSVIERENIGIFLPSSAADSVEMSS